MKEENFDNNLAFWCCLFILFVFVALYINNVITQKKEISFVDFFVLNDDE